MGKGANRGLLNNAGTGQQQNQLSGQGQALSGFLTPKLEAQATNPEGYTPEQMAYMNTASQQSLGGATAGVTGEANLEAARTKNAGGFQGAIGSGSRAAMRQNSQNAVGIQQQQANMQLQQKQQALSQLQNLYGVDEATAVSYLNSSNAALGEENKSTGASSPFMQYLYNAQKNAASASAAGG